MTTPIPFGTASCSVGDHQRPSLHCTAYARNSSISLFGNYTTLGYAGLVVPEQGRLLRPMTALNGIMLIGWSTAVIIEILRRGAQTAPSS